MTDVPGNPGPSEPDGPSGDAWDAWRRWSPPTDGGSQASQWDAWKRWEWTPVSRGAASAPGCGVNVAGLIVGAVVFAILALSIVGDALGGPEPLDADELIAGIDALSVTGARDQRPPDTSLGETVTFPAPGANPDEVAGQIRSSVKVPDRSELSDGSAFLLYEEATVSVGPVPGGSEVVVFEDNRAAARRFPLLLVLPGWSSSLDAFDSRAQSRGGIGGFRGGGGGFGK